ncbi:hypothetical protein HZA55_10130 [Candidatus Poribacteria bacterium]|nr:hypothetical protein [Candidatus Poribacteria bacterium]
MVSCQSSENPVSIIEKEGVWEIISTKNYEVGSIFFIDPANGWAVGMNGTIIHTNDGGRTWSIENSGINTTLTSVFFKDIQNGYVTGYKNTLLSTKDGGNSWNIHNIQSDSSTIFSSIHSDGYNILFISNYGEIFYSTNSGNEWNSKYKFRSYGYSYLYFFNTTYGFAMKMAGNRLYKTVDGGNNWNNYQLPPQWTGCVFFLNDRYGWLTENWAPSSSIHDSVSIHITTNGGKTWTRQSSLSGYALYNILFVNNNDGWLSDATKIFHTTDGGKSWKCQYESVDIGFIKEIYFLNDANGWTITNQGYILKYSIK